MITQPITIKNSPEQMSDELFMHILDLEKEWKKSLPRLSDKELLKIFPEAKEVIPDKIAEYEAQYKNWTEIIRNKLICIKEFPEEDQFFWREWIKVTDADELLRLEGRILRLKRLLMVARKKKLKGRLSQGQIDQALAVPLENIFNGQLRKSGNSLNGLCPFHNEKHPSFHIYPRINSFRCYGCNEGGNVIKFVMLFHGLSFRDAVKWLIKY